MKFAVLAVLLMAGMASGRAFAEHAPLQTAKVISQDLGAENGGAVVMPMGTMMIGVPITRRSDIVVLRTEHHLITLSEWMTGRGPVIVSVNDNIQFYQDGKWFIILDIAHHKHRFLPVHMEAITPEEK